MEARRLFIMKRTASFEVLPGSVEFDVLPHYIEDVETVFDLLY